MSVQTLKAFGITLFWIPILCNNTFLQCSLQSNLRESNTQLPFKRYVSISMDTL